MILDDNDPPDIEWNEGLEGRFFKSDKRDFEADPGQQFITARDRQDRKRDKAFRKLAKFSDHRGHQLRGPTDLAHVNVDAYLEWTGTPEYLKSSSRAKIKQFTKTRTDDRHSPIDNPSDDRLMSDEERSARAVWIMRNCQSQETGEGKLSITDVQRFMRPYRTKKLTEYAIKQATKLAAEFMDIDQFGEPFIIPGKFDRVEPMLPPFPPEATLKPANVCKHGDLTGRQHCPLCDHIAAENREPSPPALRARRLREKLDAALPEDKALALDMVRLSQVVDLSFGSQQRKTFRAPLAPVQGDHGLVPIRFEAGLPILADRSLKHVIEISHEWSAGFIRELAATGRNLFLYSSAVSERPDWFDSPLPPIEPFRLCECEPDAIAHGSPFGTTASYPCPLCKARSLFMICHKPSHWFGCTRCNLMFSVTYCDWIDELINNHIQRPIPGSGTNDPIAYLDRQKPQQS